MSDFLDNTKDTWEQVVDNVPAGEYDVVNKKTTLEYKESKKGEKYALLLLQTSILSGIYRGQMLFIRLNLFNNPISLGFYKRDMEKLGLDIPSNKLKHSLIQFDGLRFKVLRCQQKKAPEYMENIIVKALPSQSEEDINDIVDDSGVYVDVKNSKDDTPF